MILYSLFLIPQLVQAQVIATGVEQHEWVIDAQTAARGITLSNLGQRVRIAVAPKSMATESKVELTTFASEYFTEGAGTHRITPIYRVVVTPHPSPLPAGEGELQEESGVVRGFPVEIRYPEEELGKKSVWVWGDDDIWREISSQSVPERNAVRVKISTGTTYLAVFAHNRVLEIGSASWYRYKRCHCAASPDYPKGTELRVTNIENGKWVDVKVNDFGPDRSVHPDRVIDLDRAAFEHLANPRAGMVKVKVEKVGGEGVVSAPLGTHSVTPKSMSG